MSEVDRHRLFYAPGACSMVPHIALEEAGAVFEPVRVDFSGGDQLSAGYLAINPKGRVPALATAQGVLTEVPAILGYIGRTWPQAGLAPWEDAFAFAEMQAFHCYIATTLHVLFRQISRPECYADGAAAHAALAAKVPEMADRYFAVIERMLQDGRSFVHGDRYTLSDPYLFVFGRYLRLGDRGDTTRVPLIVAHAQRVRQRPAVQRVLAREGLADSFF